MNKTQKVVLTDSVQALADIAARRLVGMSGQPAAAGAQVYGVAEADTAAGNMAPVNVLGVLLVEAGAALSAGDELEADAEARAVTKTTGKVAGIALDAATGPGDLIRVVRGI